MSSKTPLKTPVRKSLSGKTPLKPTNSTNTPKPARARLIEAKTDEKGRVFLSDQGLESLNEFPRQPRCEFLYARNNTLSRLDLITTFPSVRVLDLSGNRLRSLSELSSFPNLTQCFVSSNDLSSLSDIPRLDSLEVLSVSHNSLTAIDLPPLKSLKQLFAGGNRIAHLRGIVNLQALEEIDLRDNPVCETAMFRIAVIHASRDTLFKINGVDLEQAELDMAYSHPVKVVECVRNGMVLSENMDAAYADRYLLNLQKEMTANMPVRIAEARIEGGDQPTEGKTMTSVFEFDFDDGFLPDFFSYQWSVSDDEFIFHPIQGAVSQSYTPKFDEFRYGLKVECSAIVKGRKAVTAFALSDNVGCGEPECASLTIEGSPIDGVTLSAVAKYVGGIPGDCRFRWFRVPDATDIPELLNPNDPAKYTYTLTENDVNCRICVEFTPIRLDAAVGKIVQATTNLVQPSIGTIPSIHGLKLRGTFIEGETLNAVPSLPEPRSSNDEAPTLVSYRWYRSSGPGAPPTQILEANGPNYTLSFTDIGSFIKVVATPYRQFDGLQGTPLHADSPNAVAPGFPTVLSLSLEGKAKEFEKLVLKAVYAGGEEGQSTIKWSRINSRKVAELVPEANGLFEYHLTDVDVDHTISVEYTPKRADGTVGVPTKASTVAPIAPGFPVCRSLEIRGSGLERDALKVRINYTGGIAGQHELRWFRVANPNERNAGFQIMSASDKPSYVATLEDVGYYIRVDCIPIRSDFTRGERVSVFTSEPIRPRPPSASPITLLGSACEKHTLTAMVQYIGGQQGNSKWQWFQLPPGDAAIARPIHGANSSRYRVTSGDIGNYLRVDFTPVREDGAVGHTVSAITELVDTGRDPEYPLGSVELIGRCEVGGTLTAVVVYDGGVEGESVFKWYRVSSDNAPQLIQEASGSSYTCTEDDLKAYIRVDYFPVRNDGKGGEAAVAVSARPVGPATVMPPVIKALQLIEQVGPDGSQTLRAMYTYECTIPEGRTIFRWFRIIPGSHPTLVFEGDQPFFPVTDVMHGARAYLEIIPVNAKGHSGTTRTATTNHIIQVSGHVQSPARQSLGGQPMSQSSPNVQSSQAPPPAQAHYMSHGQPVQAASLGAQQPLSQSSPVAHAGFPGFGQQQQYTSPMGQPMGHPGMFASPAGRSFQSPMGQSPYTNMAAAQNRTTPGMMSSSPGNRFMQSPYSAPAPFMQQYPFHR